MKAPVIELVVECSSVGREASLETQQGVMVFLQDMELVIGTESWE